MSFVLCRFDLDLDTSRTVPMDFFGHGLVQHPKEKRRAVIFEKKGPEPQGSGRQRPASR